MSHEKTAGQVQNIKEDS